MINFRSYLFCLGVFLLPFVVVSAQQAPCAFDQLQADLMYQSKIYEAEVKAYQKELLPSLQSNTRSSPNVVTIPVVVHVIHTGQSVGSGANISEARILSQIEVLNQDYRRINEDADQTPEEYLDLAVDTEVQFCLAKIDADGGATTGITRHVYSSINSIDDIENIVKPETTWDPNRYLNIWTINIPDNSVLGYSYLPTNTMVGSDRDGVVIDHPRFGYQSDDDRGRTCVHEVGHYLGLQHLWGANGNDGEPIGCNSDDGVEDTPNSAGPYYGCPSFGISSCNTTDMVMNYMEYVNDACMNLFTQGQKNVMQGNLNGIRSNLVNNGITACEEEEFGCIDLMQEEFAMGFESEDTQDGWAIENANGDNRSWLMIQNTTSDWGPNNGEGLAVYLWNVNGITAADDYLFTPCYDLQANHNYRLSFSYAVASDDNSVYLEDFEVGLSSLQSSEDFEVVNSDWVFEGANNAYPAYQTASLDFSTTSSTPKSIGFHVYSPADRYALQIDDVQLEDLGVNTSLLRLEDNSEIQLWPNPTTGEVFLTLERSAMGSDVNRDDWRIKIINTLGKLVQVNRLEAVQTTAVIDLSEQETGVYFIQIEGNGYSFTKRILVAR